LTANKTVEDFIMTLMNPIFTYLLGDGYATRPNSHLARKEDGIISIKPIYHVSADIPVN
jgi:hypothetical protein